MKNTSNMFSKNAINICVCMCVCVMYAKFYAIVVYV